MNIHSSSNRADILQKYYKIAVILVVFIVVSIGKMPTAFGQYIFNNTPLLDVIKELEDTTGYTFLYRESLLSGININLNANASNLPEKLKKSLEFTSVQIKADTDNQQIILFKRIISTKKSVTVNGQIVDAATGERLPFATLLIKHGNKTSGVSSNPSGYFSLNQTFTTPVITIRASYLGYSPQSIELDLRNNTKYEDITFRLEPTLIDGNEIIVTGSADKSDLDESLRQAVKMSTFTPLGETNSIRALQQLPSVSINPALEGGVNSRGSPVDGFQVLLDGITIYKQSHIYGLVDSFNADVLQTSGLFYDITPAEYQAPPGGTLDLYTKTGSLNQIQGTAGISNTTFKLALEGPLQNGKSSWLISSRNSYMDAVDWFNNSDLIQWGLNVNRKREILGEDIINLNDRLVDPGESDARFFDLHSKLNFEGQNGSRLIIGGYFGRDDTQQNATRLFRRFDIAQGELFENRPVSTKNEWSNGAGSIQYQVPVSSNLYSRTTAAFSIYKSEFRKEDFTFSRVNPSNNSFQVFTFPFENESVLNEIKFKQTLNFNTPLIHYTFGGQYQYFKGEYREDSFNRPGFFDQTTSHKVDGYVQGELKTISEVDLFAGTRVHYYSNGDFLKWSPRFKARFFPDRFISVGGGVSRNFQFLNQVSLSNVVTSDIWILADEEQEPASVDYYTAGIYFNKIPSTYFQIEGYIKDYENVRLHELNTLTLSNTFSNLPWFSQNDGKGKGVELFLKNQTSQFGLSHSVTISSMELHNPLLNDGEKFFVDWDRRYQYRTTFDYMPIPEFTFNLSWIFASGTPNRLATFGPADEERIGNYQRLDMSLKYRRNIHFGKMEAGFSIYNMLARDNPWFRELALVLDQSDARSQIRSVPVDVFDLGLQPSFNLSLHF